MKRIGFVTCVQLGSACIETIYRIGGRLDLAVTLHDHLAPGKSGRVHIDDLCIHHGIDLLKIANVNEPAVISAVREKQIDWLFVVGWSQIARKELLDAPRFGVFGIHPTLLPEGRGRAPIPWAILKGLTRTGVTLFRLDEGVDTGDVVAQEILPLTPDETATRLYERVAAAHQTLIERVWSDLVSGDVKTQPQDESAATIWPARTPADGAIRPEMDCASVDRLVRATTRPYPGAFYDFGRLKYRIWAGTVHRGDRLRLPVAVADGQLMLQLSDGYVAASDWAEEQQV